MQSAEMWIQSDIKRWNKICRIDGAMLEEDEFWQIYLELQQHAEKKSEFTLLIILLITEYSREFDLPLIFG
ncbi:hypothetical protein [Christensenella timonensis]|uniref:hypothetical protein n=1 Tax=Christensenella timonensis TaxID=1816678 RepID=UPI0008303B25|nr:hypothetical protein [Christensenella timonensis]